MALPLEGTFRLRIQGPRVCIGSWPDGRHRPCPQRAIVGREDQCGACNGLEHPECVFEPLCAQDAASCQCATSFRGVEHLVYLAFHGILPKVGMTQVRRVSDRLREQGADLYFVVSRGLDRGAARRLERSVAFLHRVPEHRSHHETLPQLARPVPWDDVERKAEAWVQRLAAHHPVEPLLHRITDHPVTQPLPGRPRRVAPHGLHEGAWLGAKGGHFFYAQAPRPHRLDTGVPAVAALKRWDLVGCHVEVLEPSGTGARYGIDDAVPDGP